MELEVGVRERKWSERRRVREVRVRESGVKDWSERGWVREWSERGWYGREWRKGEGGVRESERVA